ncbi:MULTISPECIES: hypothetical protein [unclassified Sphingomonas]|uniref:putative barnase/colicin E5 family endoribonuclease n=1 Tax=unclassified Sphingomonas TaxID=196159 RepID=UPI0006F99883|nr:MULTISPECIES: hypothetical protein [unclassified Sphingomonas]KQX19332.1 hypothetical protein ASD17_12375 [Sphingomonas sp. Root1294]KQY65535.1 hypothetical protein ASD39_15575 [Sphingomonas sp. Root50]KRB95165.1 hypothetical protein ASE22_04485 [Sphingomonas sp. Root720]
MGLLKGFALEQDAGLAQLPQAEPPLEDPGLFGAIDASFDRARAGPDWGWNQGRYENDAMDRIHAALAERGHTVPSVGLAQVTAYQRRLDRGEKLLPGQQHFLDMFGETMSAVSAERQRDPKFLSDMGDVRDLASLNNWVTQQRQHDVDIADRRLAGASGGEWLAGTIVGGIGAGLLDPASYIPVGGGATAGASVARQILTVAGKEALANAGMTVAMEPFTRIDAARIGEQRTIGDTAADIGLAAATGGLIGGAAKGAEVALPAMRERLITRYFDALPEGVQRRMLEAGTVDQRADAAVIPELLGADRLTPDEKAAMHVLAYDADVRESSPFKPGPEADKIHGQRLAAAIDALNAGEAPPQFAPARRPAFASQTALSSGNRDIASRIILAESGGKASARNPVPGQSASGLGQFIDSTWLSGVKKWFPAIARGKSDPQLIALKTDPALGRQMTERAVQEYRGVLGRAGLPVTADNAYLIHFLGPRRGLALIHAPGIMEIKRFLPADVISANKRVLEGKTVGEVKAWAAQQMGGEAPTEVGFAPELGDGVELRPEQFNDAGERRAAEAVLYGGERGAFGPRHGDIAGDWHAAVDRLSHDRAGEVPGALFHPDVGDIDVIWGNAKGGLAHILAKHPEVVDNLPDLIAGMEVTRSSANRVQLESADHLAKVRLDYDGESKSWLLTAFRKGKASATAEDGRVVADGWDGSPTLEAARNIGASSRSGKRMVSDAPEDLLTQIANWGGLRDDEGYDFGNTAGLKGARTRRGKVLKGNGLTIDRLGEKLWEAGWFGPSQVSERPTLDEIVDLVEEAARGRVFHPDDRALVAERERMLDDGEDEIRAMLDSAAAELGIEPDSELLDEAIARIRRGEDADDALIAAVNARFRDEMAASAEGGDDAADLAQGAMEAEDWDRLGELRDSLARWDDPDGEAAIAQAMSIEHDLRMAIEAGEDQRFMLDDGAGERGATEILEALDRDVAAAEAMRACLVPGNGATE